MTVKVKVKRVNVLIPSRTRLIGRRRPSSRIYSPQRQLPIWEIRKTTPAHAGAEFRTPNQRALSPVAQPGGWVLHTCCWFAKCPRMCWCAGLPWLIILFGFAQAAPSIHSQTPTRPMSRFPVLQKRRGARCSTCTLVWPFALSDLYLCAAGSVRVAIVLPASKSRRVPCCLAAYIRSIVHSRAQDRTNLLDELLACASQAWLEH